MDVNNTVVNTTFPSFSYDMNNTDFEVDYKSNHSIFKRKVFFIGNFCVLFDNSMRTTTFCTISYCNNRSI